jgi:hypothetical protein
MLSLKSTITLFAMFLSTSLANVASTDHLDNVEAATAVTYAVYPGWDMHSNNMSIHLHHLLESDLNFHSDKLLSTAGGLEADCMMHCTAGIAFTTLPHMPT